MGKYMKKAKEKDDVAAREVIQSASSLGVRTRAKTLALQSLQRGAAEVTGAEEDDGVSYLELRSRKLEKPASLCGSKRQKEPSSKEWNSSLDSPQRGGNFKKKTKIEEKEETEEINFQKKVEEIEEKSREEEEAEEVGDDEEEEEEKKIDEEDGFVGENCLEEFDARVRTRESTPCDLITDPEKIRTPGSSTKHPCSSEALSRLQNPMLRDIPSTQEMNEFFSSQEEQQQKRFIDKYNFDPVNDKPLPGCFEWVKVDRK